MQIQGGEEAESTKGGEYPIPLHLTEALLALKLYFTVA